MNDSYSVLFSVTGENDLKRLNKHVVKPVFKKIRWLAQNMLLVSHRPVGSTWKEFYRLELGDYRAFYSLRHDKQVLVVVCIRHRHDVYE